MVEPLARIQRSLRELTRRERRLLLVQGALGCVAGGCAAWVALAAAVNAGVATPRTGGLWIAAAILVWFGAGVWPLRRWRLARDARRQALRIEALKPELGGALLTVLDRAARPQGSPALLARLAVRAAAVAQAVKPAAVYPASAVRRVAGMAALAVAMLVLASLLLPRGPFEALAALRMAPTPMVAEALVPPEGPRAVVGDITLRYLYPTYTGREPLEVPNSNGEVHAPPGTRVEIRARTAESWPAAALVVYDAAPEPIALVDGRGLRGAFTVVGPGAWRFLFGELPSPDYAIVPEPDLAPDVAVQASQRVQTLAVDGTLALLWTARDDFGLQRVVVEVDEDGKKREVPVRTPVDVPRDLGGTLSLTPAQLGLHAGSRAKVRVAAWDNDAIAGSKAGYSSVVELEVLGPRGKQQRVDRYRRLLRDALVQVLADFLLDPSPPVATPDEAGVWAAAVAGRYERFDALVQEAWGGSESDTFDTTMLKDLREKRRAIVAFAGGLPAGAARGAVPRLAERDIASFVSLQDANVSAIENGVLMLDQVLRAAALATLAEMMTELSNEAQELRAEFADLSKEGALARLDQLQRLYQQLQREAAKLDEGGLRDFVNDRGERVQSLMDQVRKALSEGRTDDAKQLMDRLAAEMEQMAQQVQDMQQQRGKQSDEMAQAMDALQKELAELEAGQRNLREKTEAAREKHGQDLGKAVAAWEEIERLAGTVVEQLAAVDGTLEPFQSPSWSGGSLLEETRADAAGLHDSTRARDLQTALQRSDPLSGQIGVLAGRAATALRRPRGGVEGLAGARRALEGQRKNVERIRELLEEMAQRQARTSPALQEALEQLSADQEQIAERAGKAAGKAERLAENLPMDAPGLAGGAKRGAEQAGRAGQAMRAGDPMTSEGGQRAAEDGFREAQDALGEAKRNLQQMQRAGGSQAKGQGEKQGEGEGREHSGDGSDMMGQDMTLPAPEAFRTPEAYRRALLEGMEGDVPEEYKALNRRYYEELVRQ